MGFGLVFIGYITLVFFKILPPAMALGAYFMYKGFKKLKLYNRAFEVSTYLSAVLFGYHILYSTLWASRFFRAFEGVFSSKIFILCDDIIYYCLLLLLHIFMYRGLEEICKFCGYHKGIKKVYMSRVITTMVYALTIINVPISLTNNAGYLPFALLLCQLVWIVYTSALIYSCYMRIATEEIIQEEEKKIAEYDAKHAYKSTKTSKK